MEDSRKPLEVLGSDYNDKQNNYCAKTNHLPLSERRGNWDKDCNNAKLFRTPLEKFSMEANDVKEILIYVNPKNNAQLQDNSIRKTPKLPSQSSPPPLIKIAIS